MLLPNFLTKIRYKNPIFWPKEAVSAEIEHFGRNFPGALFRFRCFGQKSVSFAHYVSPCISFHKSQNQLNHISVKFIFNAISENIIDPCRGKALSDVLCSTLLVLLRQNQVAVQYTKFLQELKRSLS